MRDLCIFSSHSVIRDPPFSRIDLISCRNLLIYLDRDCRTRCIPVFHYALRPGGYLFLGSSETLTQHADLFEPVDKKHRIFQPARSRRHPPAPAAGAAQRAAAGRRTPGSPSGTITGLPLRHIVENRVLEQFAPAMSS